MSITPSIRNKVAVSHFAPKKVAFDNYADAPYTVGAIVGKVSKLFSRTDQRTGEEYNGLAGAFRQIVGNDLRNPTDIIESGVCYLPPSLQEMVVSAFDAAGGEDAHTEVRFAYLVQLVRRGEQDYSWAFVDLQPPKAESPLATLTSEVVAALPEPAPAVTASPAKSKTAA